MEKEIINICQGCHLKTVAMKLKRENEMLMAQVRGLKQTLEIIEQEKNYLERTLAVLKS